MPSSCGCRSAPTSTSCCRGGGAMARRAEAGWQVLPPWGQGRAGAGGRGTPGVCQPRDPQPEGREGDPLGFWSSGPSWVSHGVLPAFLCQGSRVRRARTAGRAGAAGAPHARGTGGSAAPARLRSLGSGGAPHGSWAARWKWTRLKKD